MMFRRVLSLVLILLLLLTQLAQFHCHAAQGGQGPRAPSNPHVHLSSLPFARATCAGHHHGHTHGDHGHHHHGPGGHHHHDDDDVAPPGGDMLPTQQPEPLSDHDSDAVFIAAVDAVAGERSRVDDEVVSSAWWAAAETTLFAASWDRPPGQPATWAHPPPLADSLCPLYVRHLALLI